MAGGAAVVSEDGAIVVAVVSGLDCTAVPAHPANKTRASVMPGSDFIERQLLQPLAPTGSNVGVVFGPLNGVRTALVIAAIVAALVSLIAGYAGAAGILMLGVAIHGLGWLYLYAIRERTSAK